MQTQAFCAWPVQNFGHCLTAWRQPLHRAAMTWLSARADGTVIDTGKDDRATDPGPPDEGSGVSLRKRPLALRDIFSPRRTRTAHDGVGGRSMNGGGFDASNEVDCWAADVGRGAEVLQRLDRLQQVANLALEDRRPGEAWACADIGADHGLLAICLHANGADVIAGDRADRPVQVARKNFRFYLWRAQDLAAAGESPVMDSNEGSSGGDVGLTRAREGPKDSSEKGETAQLRRRTLECRQGEGLAVLEKGEADTVCIAGMGVKTMIQILSETRRSKVRGGHCRNGSQASDLSSLRIERLVLQPMDARLEYVRALRVWLRENGWHIVQETIASTVGKGGRRAYITLRADLSAQACNNQLVLPEVLSAWPGEYEQGADWLGSFLPARATDERRFADGAGSRQERREALTFLAYLKHQRNWLLYIERARSAEERDHDRVTSRPKSIRHGRVANELDRVIISVENALGRGKGVLEGLPEQLSPSRKWKRTVERRRA